MTRLSSDSQDQWDELVFTGVYFSVLEEGVGHIARCDLCFEC